METLKMIDESENRINERKTQRVRTGRVFRSFLTIFMLSSVLILSSCAVGVRTPQYNSSGVIIERHYRSERPVRVQRIRVQRPEKVRTVRVERIDRKNRRDRDKR